MRNNLESEMKGNMHDLLLLAVYVLLIRYRLILLDVMLSSCTE